MKVVNFTQIKDELINNMRRKMLIPVIGSGFTRGCDAYKGKVPSGKDYSEYMISKIAAQLSLAQAEIDSLKRDSFSNVSDIYHRAIPISSQKEYLKFNLGQFTRNYTQTTKRGLLTTKQAEYQAPGKCEIFSLFCCQGFPKGFAPWHTTLLAKCSVLYALSALLRKCGCRREGQGHFYGRKTGL